MKGQENRQIKVPRWNRGRMAKLLRTSFLSSGSCRCLKSSMWSPMATCICITVKKFRSASITALLRPVVPEVNSMTIRALGSIFFSSPPGAVSFQTSIGRRRSPYAASS